jgi:hypothetical protein
MIMGGRRWRQPVAPQVRGHVPPRVLEDWAGQGWAIHRVGRAAYVHHPEGLHLIVGVWPRRDPAPTWSARLGRASAGYMRRLERCAVEQRGRTMLRDRLGRFLARLPWWRWPAPRVYSFEPAGPSLYDLERGRP